MKGRNEKQIVGAIGEDIAARFLVKHGYEIVDRNFLVKGGELDIIAKKVNKLAFVEVKTVSRENVSRETFDLHRPEDNIHKNKIRRMSVAIALFLDIKKFEQEYEILFVTVELDRKNKRAKVSLLSDFGV